MNHATRTLLEQHFDTAFAAPDGIAKLRELILTLAMQGKLVEQNPADLPALELLKDIDTEKQRLVKTGKMKAPKPLPPVTPEEVPYPLPQGWAWVRLGGIASYIQRGKGPTYTDFSTHRVISQKCVRWHGLDLEPARYIAPESLQKYEAIRFLRAGDLLWNSTGTGTIGRACLAPENVEDHEIVVDSHVTVVRPVLISPLFLWRWIQSPIVQDEIEGSASGTTNQIELNTSTVINHLMPLPPLPEQYRIVARIDQLMARCDSLEALRKEREGKRLAVHAAAIQRLLSASSGSAWDFIQQHFGELYSVKANVAELRKAILQLAVMGRLVPQDPEDPPASELLKEIDAEKQRLVKTGKIKAPKPLPLIKPEEVPYQLPQGWEWVRLGEIGIINPRNDADDLARAGFVPMPMIPEGYSEKHQFEERSWSEIKKGYTHFANGDIGMAKITPCFENGKSCVFSGLPNGIGAGTTELHIFRNSFNSVEPRFLLWHLKNPHYISKAVPKMTGSAGQKRVPTPYFTEQLFPLAPLPEQHRIVARIDQLMALCDALEQKISDATDKQTELLHAVMVQF